jgi:hypothetical protein
MLLRVQILWDVTLYRWRSGPDVSENLVATSSTVKEKILLRFNVHGSVHHNSILVYKSQQDAYVT